MDDSINPQPRSFRQPKDLHESAVHPRLPAAEATRPSQSRDHVRSGHDQTTAPTDLGSRWCPEEMEIFFNCKLKHAQDKLFSSLIQISLQASNNLAQILKEYWGFYTTTNFRIEL